MARKKRDDWFDPSLIDSHQQRKHMRIMAIAEVIENRGGVNYKQFIAEMQYHGLRKIVAEEYIEVLKDLGKVRVDRDDVMWNGENQIQSSRSNIKKTAKRICFAQMQRLDYSFTKLESRYVPLKV